MQDYLIVYSEKEILARTKTRQQEIKIGENVKTVFNAAKWEEELQTMQATFVVLGLPEDIGVRANYGRGGAYAAWKPALDFLLNMQSNQF